MRLDAILIARSGRALTVLLPAVLLACFAPSPTAAEGETVSIVKIEEDWELVVAEADVDRDAPQVTVVLSPLGHLNGLYAAFELNHQTQPTYAGGGLQLQVWSGSDAPLATRTQKDGQNLAYAGETVTWTQKMECVDGQIAFSVSGNSQSWGVIGGPLHASVTSTLANLNSYSPLVSVNGSGAGFASNRVTSLKLKKVKAHLSTGQVIEDGTVRTAYPKS